VRAPIILRKTVGDLSDVRVLVAYFVGFLTVAGFLALGFANNEFEGATTLAEQETRLFGTFVTLAYLWGTGVPVLVLGAVFGASTLAREGEKGRLRVLLSKPVRRWEVLVGTFGGIVVYLFLVAVASTLLTAVLIYEMADVSAAALEGGVFAALPGTLAFALFVSVFMAAIGVCASVFTKNRLQTALAALVVPAFYFAFMMIRLVSRSFYEDYYLYALDAGYHLGHVFVLAHETLGEEFAVQPR